MKLRHLAALLLLVFATGCANDTYVFQVSVRNQTAEPITVWLTKDGPPDETNWIAPEVLATKPFDSNTPIPGVDVKPGEIATVGPIAGHFPEGVGAVVRVYRGDLNTLPKILAVPPTSPNRRDLLLMHPGASDYIIRDENGRLIGVPVVPKP